MKKVKKSSLENDKNERKAAKIPLSRLPIAARRHMCWLCEKSAKRKFGVGKFSFCFAVKMDEGGGLVPNSRSSEAAILPTKRISPHFLQNVCLRECALVRVLVTVLVISVYGCFVGRSLLRASGRVSLFRRRQNSEASFLGRLFRRATK